MRVTVLAWDMTGEYPAIVGLSDHGLGLGRRRNSPGERPVRSEDRESGAISYHSGVTVGTSPSRASDFAGAIASRSESKPHPPFLIEKPNVWRI
jgi:hypothetical protein